ncbi:YjcZ family sporulation protein [Bacillus nitroreducens]
MPTRSQMFLHNIPYKRIGGVIMGQGYGGGFALIVVLFILLIIVGAAWF